MIGCLGSLYPFSGLLMLDAYVADPLLSVRWCPGTNGDPQDLFLFMFLRQSKRVDFLDYCIAMRIPYHDVPFHIFHMIIYMIIEI